MAFFSFCLYISVVQHSLIVKRYNWASTVICVSLRIFLTVRLRLSGKDFTFHGRVEIFFSGLWGTVCHDWWNLQSARVVCRQLGFDGAVAARPWSAFGHGKGVIWMNRVQCTGHESSIADCFFNGWGIDSCPFYHFQDASAVCRQPGNWFSVLYI